MTKFSKLLPNNEKSNWTYGDIRWFGWMMWILGIVTGYLFGKFT